LVGPKTLLRLHEKAKVYEKKVVPSGKMKNYVIKDRNVEY
jgi:hypothetical protein